MKFTLCRVFPDTITFVADQLLDQPDITCTVSEEAVVYDEGINGMKRIAYVVI